MSRWLDRAAAICADAPTLVTDKTDESMRLSPSLELLSVVAPAEIATSGEADGLVSVLSVPEAGPFEDSTIPVLDDWYRRGWLWDELETQTFLMRHAHFKCMGLTDTRAEALAEKLVVRDRDGDDRRWCVECQHCRVGPRCAKQLAVPAILQRCDYFEPPPCRETPDHEHEHR